MIVLKHLARDINYDPHRLRKILRHIYGKVKGHRWKWEGLTDPHYLKVKQQVLSHANISLLPPAYTNGKLKPSSSSKPSRSRVSRHTSSSNAVSTKRKSS